MRTVQDFVQDCINRGKSLEEIRRIAIASQWKDKVREVEEAFETFRKTSAA